MEEDVGLDRAIGKRGMRWWWVEGHAVRGMPGRTEGREEDSG